MLKKTNQKGFTIIEVLIVLAIAALIMLVVFLAVPALQRSQRNNARSSEASVLAAAINECVSNNNGKTTNCAGLGNSGTTQVPFVVADQAKQLTETDQDAFPSGNPVGSKDAAAWKFGLKCDGSGVTDTGASDRTFVVVYAAETTSGETPRCIEG